MNKLRLNVDSLRVESFVPAPLLAAPRGTVHLHQSGPEEPQTIVATCECPPTAGQNTCAGVFTCDWSCGCPGTAATCGGATCGEYTCVESCYPCVPHG